MGVGLLVAGGVAVVCTAASYMIVRASELPQRSVAARARLNFGPQPVPVGSNPFITGGRVVSLAQARSLAGFAVPVPDSALASPEKLSKVWFASWKTDDGTVEREVVLDYVSSNIRITIDPAGAGFGSDPRAAYLKEAASIGQPESSVQTVNGAPALVVAAANGQNGFVDMDMNGIHIAVIGPYSATELIAVANTLQP